MTNLFKMEAGSLNAFVGKLAEAGMTAELAEELRRDPARLKQMVTAILPDLNLLHDRFTPLARKLETVRGYPGVTPEMVERALEEATTSGLLARYEAESPDNPFLEAAVTVYRGSVPETLLYARDRMRETHGNEFWQWDPAYAGNVDENRVRLLKGVQEHRDGVRIEVFDAAEGWNPEQGFVPAEVRNHKSATFAPIFAAAQSPEWVRQMDGESVPFCLCGGLELNVPGVREWAHLPRVDRHGGGSELNGRWHDSRYRFGSLPSLRE